MTKKYFLSLIFLSSTLLTARADIIPTLDSITNAGSNFQWNYSVNVTLDQQVRTGDFFTIFDFAGFVPGSAMQPEGWLFSSSLIGLTPPTVLPQDDPGIFNLTWTYVGTTPIVGPQFLGIFSAISDTNQLGIDNFAARATRSTGSLAGTPIDNIGLIAVPVPEMSALAPIIGVSGLAALGFFSSLIRRRRLS